MQERYLKCQQQLVAHRQQHLLRFWDELTDDQRSEWLNTLESIPWVLITRLIETYAKAKPEAACPTPLEPAPAFRKEALQKSQDSTFQQANQIGDQLLRSGQVAAFTVAGGQGTRLGFDGPKGAMPMTPIKKKTFFQLFAEMLKAVQMSHGRALPWYIMTSSANHAQTTGFFKANEYFGLNPTDVVFFSQAMLPSFDANGNLLLASKYQLALSPDGHGGSLKALYDHGALKDMQDRGIQVISYFQVDNPLVRPFDPLFLGLHAMTGSEMSTKVTAKTSDQERVGNLCMHNGRQIVVEYSDFPAELATAKNADGSRKFDLGNLGTHAIDVQFVSRIVGDSLDLPYHRAEKAVPFVDNNGVLQTPRQPNGIKLEKFIFDALPLANKPMLLEIDRTDEFAPVKNATGSDSPATSISAQIARDAKFLESCGVQVARKADGTPDAMIEIAPSFHANSQPSLPASVASGQVLYLE